MPWRSLIPTLSRSALLGAGSAIALVGLPLMARFVEAAQASVDPADIDTLNSAIELERAGIKAYADAGATGLVSPAVAKVAMQFVADHTAHRDALVAAVRASGGKPSSAVAKLAYPEFSSERDVIAFAIDVEMKAANTYLSVIPDFANRQLAQVAASILGVESTHVALLENLLGKRAYATGFVT